MHEDQPFRLLLTVGVAALVPILAYYRVKSQATGEKLDRRQEGICILFSLRLMGLLFFSSLMAYLIDPSWLAWSSLPLPSWSRWAGGILFVTGGVLAIWTFANLGRNLTDTVVTRKEHTLVKTGPYRWTRHPFYGAVAILVLAVGLISASWLFALGGGAVFGLLVMRTRREEGKLLERFGDEYRRYIDRTGRFVPRFRRPHHGLPLRRTESSGTGKRATGTNYHSKFPDHNHQLGGEGA
jgi:protein-S-isoprenylcysteine O-methyltransferase Ste14